MLKNYITVAWRTLLRNRLYFFINVLGLSVGISACLVIFLIVNFELSFDQFHPDGERIYRVYSQLKGDYNGFNRGVPAAFAPAAKNELTGADQIAAFHTWSSNVSVFDGKNGRKDFAAQDRTIFAGPDYFELFQSYEWLAGSPVDALTKPFQGVLTESKAKTYFGIKDAREAIGREIHYHDSLIVSIAGIVKDIRHHTDFDFTDFISFSTISSCWLSKDIRLDDWQSTNSSSLFFIKLAPGTSPARVETSLQKLAESHRKKDKDDHQSVFYLLQPLSDIHFNSDLDIFNHSRPAAHMATLRMLVVIALLLLAIASINFINLETAQAVRRAKEVGVRKVMGSKRGELVLHFLMQSYLLTLFAVVVALPLSELAITFFKDFIPQGVRLHLSDSFTLMFLGLSVLLVGFLAGFYPAFSLSSYLPVLSLKNQVQAGSRTTRTGFIRKGLIIFQFTFAQALIVATLIVGWQISFMLNKDLGFSKDAIVYFDTPWWEQNRKAVLLKNELMGLPEIKALSLCAGPPASTSWSSSTFKFSNGKEDLHHNVFLKFGDTAFFSVFNFQLLAGRNLNYSDSIREFVINETYAKLLGFRKPQEALNKEVEFNDKKYPIVGVVKDFHFQSLHSAIEPAVIADEEKDFKCIGIKLAGIKRGSEIRKAIEKIEAAWKKIYPDQKFEYSFLDNAIASFYEKEKQTAKLVSTATAIAILISCLGLFGLASFTTMQRTKEIGIRKVLGATVNNIVTLLSGEFLWLVTIAFVLAAPLSYFAANDWLSDFAYRTTIGWQVFAWTILASLLIVLLSVSYQAVKAAVADPVKSLRYE